MKRLFTALQHVLVLATPAFNSTGWVAGLLLIVTLLRKFSHDMHRFADLLWCRLLRDILNRFQRETVTHIQAMFSVRAVVCGVPLVGTLSLRVDDMTGATDVAVLRRQILRRLRSSPGCRRL